MNMKKYCKKIIINIFLKNKNRDKLVYLLLLVEYDSSLFYNMLCFIVFFYIMY